MYLQFNFFFHLMIIQVVPITAKLPNGFKTGWQLEITGRVKILPSSFYINLQQGDTLWPHPIIPLHLNPRFCELTFCTYFATF